MNILMHILPGLRETRSPLTVGALWIASAIALWPRVARKINLENLIHIPNLWNKIPDYAQVSLVLAGVYVLGVICTEIARGFLGLTNIFVQAIKNTPYILPLAPLIFVANMFGNSLPGSVNFILTFVIVGMFAVIMKGWLFGFRSQALAMISVRSTRLNAFLYRAAGRFPFLTSYQQIEQAKIAQKYLRRYDLLQPRWALEVVENLSTSSLFFVATQLPFSEHHLLQNVPRETLRKYRNLKQLLHDKKNHEMFAPMIRNLVKDSMGDYTMRKKLYALEQIDKTKMDAEMVLLIETYDLKLQLQHPTIYEEFARLKGEAEFRKAISIPSAFLAGAITWQLYTPQRIVADDSNSVTHIYISILLFFSIYTLGRAKNQQASEVLFSAINLGLLDDGVNNWISNQGLISADPVMPLRLNSAPSIKPSARLRTRKKASRILRLRSTKTTPS